MISRDSGRLKPKSVGGRYATGYPIDSGQRQGVAAGDLDAAVEMLEAREGFDGHQLGEIGYIPRNGMRTQPRSGAWDSFMMRITSPI